jgi:hypothetical protein
MVLSCRHSVEHVSGNVRVFRSLDPAERKPRDLIVFIHLDVERVVVGGTTRFCPRRKTLQVPERGMLPFGLGELDIQV